MAEQTETRPDEQRVDDLPEIDETMEAIVARRAAEMQGESNTSRPPKQDPPASAETVAETHQQTESTEADPPPQRVVAAPESFVRIKVNGQEREVPLADVVKNFQMDEAAQQRLEHAKALEQSAKAREREWHDRVAALHTGTQAKEDDVDQPTGGTQTQARQDRKRAFEKAMDAWSIDGDIPDDAIDILFPQTQAAPQAQDPVQVAALVRTQMRTEDIIRTYEKDFPDISGDPFLDQVAGVFMDEYLAQGQDVGEAIRNAALATREWGRAKFGGPAQTSAAPAQSSAAQTRQHAQTTLKNIPGTASGRRAGIDPHPKMTVEQYRRQAIDEMMDQN